jgi:hypothetical protein
MEYKLNKIDPDLRQKIIDSSREGLVHGTKNIEINKDKQEEKRRNRSYKLEDFDKSKKLVVKAVKVENVQVEAFKEKAKTDDNTKGMFLDIKK